MSMDPVSTIVETIPGSGALSTVDGYEMIVLCEASAPATIQVPRGLRKGSSVEVVQAGAGQVSLVPGDGAVLRYPATFLPNTNELWSSLVVTSLGETSPGVWAYLVRGDMEAA